MIFLTKTRFYTLTYNNSHNLYGMSLSYKPAYLKNILGLPSLAQPSLSSQWLCAQTLPTIFLMPRLQFSLLLSNPWLLYIILSTLKLTNSLSINIKKLKTLKITSKLITVFLKTSIIFPLFFYNPWTKLRDFMGKKSLLT